MDVFVKSYVPQWLTEVNRHTANVRKIGLSKDLSNIRASYIASFSGTDVWQKGPEDVPGSGNGTRLDKSQTVLYNQHLNRLIDCLILEESACHERAHTWNRYQVRLFPYPRDFRSQILAEHASVDFLLFECTVPGIQDFNPPVFLNDRVELRQLVPEYMHFDDTVYTATVFGVRRSKEVVIIKTPFITLHSGLFNLIFLHDHQPSRDQIMMLRSLSTCQSNPFCQRFLFPDINTCLLKTQLTTVQNFLWKDSSLNLEQKKAVQEIVDHKYGQLPYLIQGPPGTGKTKTVVEAILQILHLDPGARIIACAPSNTAADTIALRLIKEIRDPKLLLRMNAISRSFEEVPEPLLPYSSIENDTFCLPKFSKLMTYRVIVGTVAEISELTHVNCSNKSLSQFYQYSVTAMHSSPSMPDSKPHFTHLFLDEAGQATEPQSICAIQVLNPELYPKISIVLAGDHRQLGPQIVSEEARIGGLDNSLFERLIELPCYSDHPLSRKNIRRDPRPKLPYPYTPFANLYRNYRSHESILMVPSQLSYDSSLAACATGVHSISDAIADSVPVSFIGHNGHEDVADINVVTSWFNQTEVNLVLSQVSSLVNQTKVTIKAGEIAILTPFREQVLRIRRSLREAGFAAVGVGTVEDYQGAESRIVILSIVRTRERFLTADRASHLGLIHEKRRINVALTRAKELLLVIGHPHLMRQDESWRSWLAFCERHGTYTGYRIPEAPSAPQTFEDPPLISSLEKAYTFRESNTPSLGQANLTLDLYSDEAMILAGHAAQLALEDAE